MRGPGALGGRVVVRGVTLASLCARISASKGSEGLADEALVAALGGAHCVELALAREAPPLVAAPTGAASHVAVRLGRLARAGSSSVVVVPGAAAPAGTAHSVERRRLAADRRPVDGMRGVEEEGHGVVGCEAARSSRGRLLDEGAAAAHRRAPARSWRHEGAP